MWVPHEVQRAMGAQLGSGVLNPDSGLASIYSFGKLGEGSGGLKLLCPSQRDPKTTKEPILMQTHKGLYYELTNKDSHHHRHHHHHCSRSEVRASSLGVQSIYCGYSKRGGFPFIVGQQTSILKTAFLV